MKLTFLTHQHSLNGYVHSITTDEIVLSEIDKVSSHEVCATRPLCWIILHISFSQYYARRRAGALLLQYFIQYSRLQYIVTAMTAKNEEPRYPEGICAPCQFRHHLCLNPRDTRTNPLEFCP